MLLHGATVLSAAAYAAVPPRYALQYAATAQFGAINGGGAAISGMLSADAHACARQPCLRVHRHCKAYRYRLRRAELAGMLLLYTPTAHWLLKCSYCMLL